MLMEEEAKPLPSEMSNKLVEAAKIGNVAEISVCLQKGAEVDFNEGEPLYASAWRGRIDVVRLLLRHGANPNAGDDRAARQAAACRQRKVVELLVSHGAAAEAMTILERAEHRRAFSDCIRQNDLEEVKRLISQGWDFDTLADPLLHLASLVNSVAIVNEILDSGRFRFENPEEILANAVSFRRVEITRSILEHQFHCFDKIDISSAIRTAKSCHEPQMIALLREWADFDETQMDWEEGWYLRSLKVIEQQCGEVLKLLNDMGNRDLMARCHGKAPRVLAMLDAIVTRCREERLTVGISKQEIPDPYAVLADLDGQMLAVVQKFEGS